MWTVLYMNGNDLNSEGIRDARPSVEMRPIPFMQLCEKLKNLL